MMYVYNDGEFFYRSTLKFIQLHTYSECRKVKSAIITNIKNTVQNTTDTIHTINMTSYSSADIRQMVDDIDDAIRTSVDNGEVEKEFERKRGDMVRDFFYESLLCLKVS